MVLFCTENSRVGKVDAEGWYTLDILCRMAWICLWCALFSTHSFVNPQLLITGFLKKPFRRTFKMSCCSLELPAKFQLMDLLSQQLTDTKFAMQANLCWRVGIGSGSFSVIETGNILMQRGQIELLDMDIGKQQERIVLLHPMAAMLEWRRP